LSVLHAAEIRDIPSRFFGALPDTMMNMSDSYIFTVKSTSHVICAVWSAKEFNLQLTPDMARMIVDQVGRSMHACVCEVSYFTRGVQSAAVECLRRTARDNPSFTKLTSYDIDTAYR